MVVDDVSTAAVRSVGATAADLPQILRFAQDDRGLRRPMHILLTDVLTCPRCGPEFGLIVLADSLLNRRVSSGRLGCANCRESYPIEGGVADLRRGGGATPALAPPAPPADVEEASYRVAALLGVGEASGMVLLGGFAPEVVARVAELLPGAEIAALAAGGGAGPEHGYTLLRADGTLPFRSRSLRGVALSGAAAASYLDEALRVLLPGTRLVLDPAPDDAAAHLRDRGCALLLQEAGVVVASPPVAR
jgi:uncharacterized protein YbaR (Trm112 family)